MAGGGGRLSRGTLRRVPGVVFCPCPPVLVPAVAQGAAAEVADVLTACDGAVRALLAGAADVVVVGPGPSDRVHPGSAGGTLRGFGVAVHAGGSQDPELPLALTVGAWLLDRAGVDVPRRYVEVGPAGTGPEGTWLAGAGAVLVMGDGTARLDERAPGGLDPAAGPYDASVVAALASGDPASLAVLDTAEGVRMMAAGVPAWRAVGSALLEVGGSWTAELLAHRTPYGVSYVVARWS